MGNIDMWHHPKYYKELRKLRNKLDQAISKPDTREVVDSVRPDPGLKPQASSDKHQAASHKRQASSSKPR
tara:strand:+ start:2214 stop:2423 length:210 start_codon:yes stop_codon:yes gene_type:complete